MSTFCKCTYYNYIEGFFSIDGIYMHAVTPDITGHVVTKRRILEHVLRFATYLVITYNYTLLPQKSYLVHNNAVTEKKTWVIHIPCIGILVADTAAVSNTYLTSLKD